MYRLNERQLHKSRRRYAVLALIVLGAGSVAVALTWPSAAPPKAAEVVIYSTDRPVESKPASSYQWPGAPDDPKSIAIASIGLEGYIQQVGVDQHREIATPSNIHMAGWFVDSVRPGQKGLAIIDGHLNGRQQDGIFRRLGSVKPGDKIVVMFGSGEQKTFVAMSTKTVPAGEAQSVLFSQDPGVASQLNLITCTGSFDWDARRYSDRVIVTAKLSV
jgi:LPXTG-site transpeptidase (sortase) family protein